MGRIRVLCVVDRVSAGGAEQLACELAARLDPARFEATVCETRAPAATAGADAARARLAAAGVRHVPLARRAKADLHRLAPLVRELRRCDVAHAHLFGSSLWTCVLGRAARTPALVVHEHGWDAEAPLERLLKRRLVAPAADAVVAVAEAERRRLVERVGLPEAKVRVIANGIDDLPARSRAEARRSLGIGDDVTLVGAVGRLHSHKAFDVLVRAAVPLREQVPGVRIVVAGEGGEREALERLARELGVAGTVSFIGQSDDVPSVLAALDAAVSSSASEGSPLALMEYMDAGLPIVATAVGGVPDVAGDAALLVPPGDPEALAAAVARLLADPAAAAQLGSRARERRRAEFSLDRTVGELEALYAELFANSGRSRSATASQV